MTYGGLRGAVAYYLALNLHTPYKDTLTTMTVVLICFTVIGLGSTTNLLLKILNACCKKDKIIVIPVDEDEDELLLEDSGDLKSDETKSEGFFSRLEEWDTNVAQKYLRRGSHISRGSDDKSEVEFDENDLDDASSVVTKRKEALYDFFNRDIRGGDLSPYRRFQTSYNRGSKKESKPVNEQLRHDLATPVSFWGNINNHKKSEFIPKYNRMATNDSGQRTMKTKVLGLTKNSTTPPATDGFTSCIPQNSSDLRLRIPLNLSENEEDNSKQVIKLDRSKSASDVNDKKIAKRAYNSNKRNKYGKSKKLSTLIEEDEGNDSGENSKKVPRAVTERKNKLKTETNSEDVFPKK
jgi:hypothetical protein